MFGLNFGELFIIGFVLITVLAAPYAGRVGERVAALLNPKRESEPSVNGSESSSSPDKGSPEQEAQPKREAD